MGLSTAAKAPSPLPGRPLAPKEAGSPTEGPQSAIAGSSCPPCHAVGPVCERHFKAEDIARETSYIDQATGRTVTTPLSRLRLRAEAVPTVFPDCPSYLSIESSRREDPESKQMRLEAAFLEKVLAESILTAKKEEEADKLCDLKDVANFVRGKKLTFLHVIECSDHVILAHICNDDAPWIKYSVVVKTDLTLTVNVAKASVKRLGSKMVVPSVIDSKRRLLELLEGVEGFDSAQRSSSENSTADIFETVTSLLNELYTAQESDNTPIIQLFAEQVNDQNQNWEELQTQAAVPSGKFYVVVTQEALSKLKDVIPVVTYVVGYSVHIAVKRLKCDKCRELLTIDKTVSVSPENRMYSLVKEIDRGGLVYPAMPAVNAVAHNYVVVEELSKCAEFLKVQNKRQVATELTLQLLSDEEPSDFDVCEKGHASEVVLKYILWCSTNILLKNFCRRLNNRVSDPDNKSKKRKLQNLTNK
ncbi:hypothetical protein MRX96_059366 [Rhipicephalus microplus]